jgi:hypothetical protein
MIHGHNNSHESLAAAYLRDCITGLGSFGVATAVTYRGCCDSLFPLVRCSDVAAAAAVAQEFDPRGLFPWNYGGWACYGDAFCVTLNICCQLVDIYLGMEVMHLPQSTKSVLVTSHRGP